MQRPLTIWIHSLSLAVLLAPPAAQGQTETPGQPTAAADIVKKDVAKKDIAKESESATSRSIPAPLPQRRESRLERLRNDLVGARLVGEIAIQRGGDRQRIEKKLQRYIDSIELEIEDIVELPNGAVRLDARFGKAPKERDGRAKIRRSLETRAKTPGKKTEEEKPKLGIRAPIEVWASYHGASVVLTAKSIYIPGLGIASGRIIVRDDRFAARWQARGYEGTVRGKVHRDTDTTATTDAPPSSPETKPADTER